MLTNKYLNLLWIWLDSDLLLLHSNIAGNDAFSDHENDHVDQELPKLNAKMRSGLRNKLYELRVTIIDEISMVSNLQLLYIHFR